MNNSNVQKLRVAFAKNPAAHWVPRLIAGGVEVKEIDPPVVSEDNTVTGLPDQEDGVLILVNARVASALKGSRPDLVMLPQNAAQIGEPSDPSYKVSLDYLLPVQ